MKKQIRFTLLFALAVLLAFSALAAIPFSALANEQYTLTIYAVVLNGNEMPPKGITDYGSIRISDNTGATILEGDGATISYQGEAADLILTVEPNANYTFVAWTDDPAEGDELGEGTVLPMEFGANTVRYAVFEPKEYKIYYVGANNEPAAPDAVNEKYGTDEEYHPKYNKAMSFPRTRNYGSEAVIPAASAKTGTGAQTHVFNGWNAFNAAGEPIDEFINSTIGATVNCDVYLVPQWEPLQFTATRIDRIGTPEHYEETELGRYEQIVNYGVLVSGKDFGDNPDYLGYEFHASDPALYTEVAVGTDGAVVYRYYTPCEYVISFNINAPVEDRVTENGAGDLVISYKANLPQSVAFPKCTGYRFLGYYYTDEESGEEIQYFDYLGRVGEIKTWEIPHNVTMTAKWELQTHEVIVRVVDGKGNDCSDAVQVLINGADNPGPMEYGTQGEVSVTVLEGQNKKLTKWNGTDIAHTLSASGAFEIGEANVIFTVQLLPMEAAPNLSVDYAGETLNGFTAGVYRITIDDVSHTVTVAADGSVDDAEAISLSDLFGKTLLILRPGTANKTADGEVQQLVLNARPAAVAKEEVKYTLSETKQSRELFFSVPNGTAAYEIAVTATANEEPQNWTSELHLTGLEAGTPYTVWLRVRATENAPHGEATRVLKNFEFSHLVDLKPLFILLLCLFALQLVALVFLLISRRRARMNAFAAPLLALLAVKTVPAGFFPWVIVLTIAVIGLQIVLVCLALQTSVIWKKRTEKKKDQTGEPATFTLFGEETKPAGEDAKKEDENE